jgi:hypothetical protein
MKSLGIRYHEKKRLKIGHQIAGIDTYESEVALKVKTHPTLRALDAGILRHFQAVFHALSFSNRTAFRRPPQRQ